MQPCQIMANVATFSDGPADRAVPQAWVSSKFAAALRQGDGRLRRLVGRRGPARVRQAYPGLTEDRLVAVKRRYQPTNLFRLNQTIS